MADVRQPPFVETDIQSPLAVRWVIAAESTDRRDWLRHAAACPLLKQHRIVHLGVAHMPPPFEIVRTNLSGSYFLACLAGEGRVLVDGRWQRVRPGMAFLLPPGARQAFHASGTGRWDYCWVRFREERGQRPLASGSLPVLARFDGEPLKHAMLGLHQELTHGGVPVLIDQWLQLVLSYVRQFSEPQRLDERIWRLWTDVESRLSESWTSHELARVIHVSEKQLERLCRQELGRTPRQQLIWLRMRRAAELLSSTDLKIETIAHQVGYQNAFVFSTTFKNCMGWPPSEYPGRVKG